jgi:hypothetical protein
MIDPKTNKNHYKVIFFGCLKNLIYKNLIQAVFGITFFHINFMIIGKILI